MTPQPTQSTIAPPVNSGMHSLISGFASPAAPFPFDFALNLRTEYARHVAILFMDRFSNDVETSMEGFRELVDRWLARTASLSDVWDASIGDLFVAKAKGDLVRAELGALGFAIHVLSQGVPGHLHARVPKPMGPLWAGWLLPVFEEITIQSNGEAVSIEVRASSNRKNLQLVREGGEWKAAELERILSVGPKDAAIRLLHGQAMITPTLEIARAKAVETVSDDDLTRAQGALDILARHAGEYYLWVTRLVRNVALLKRTSEETRSGSFLHAFGTIFATAPADALSFGETLVHEAAHQYASFISAFGSLTNGGHTAVHYSPVKRQMRSLDRILLAYHAYGNILAYYRRCRDGEAISPATYDTVTSRLLPILRDLDGPLAAGDGLSEIGWGLYEPLASQLSTLS